MNAVQVVAGGIQQPTIPQIINIFWHAYSQNINSGAWTQIEVPIAVRSLISDEGISVIATRFRDLIQAPVATIDEPHRGVIIIRPLRSEFGHGSIIAEASDSKDKVVKKAKVARPANAFILYRQHHHPLIKAEHPELHNNQISIILGTQWKNEAESIKKEFVDSAKRLKAQHLLDHPDYQYQPRKPSEKKKRISRRQKVKAAGIVNHLSSSSTQSKSTGAEALTTTPDSSAVMPEFARTQAGNTVIELSDKDLSDTDFSVMLQRYNDSIPQANNLVGAMLAHKIPSVIYDERTEEAQNDANFHSSQHDFNSWMTNEELAAQMDALMEGIEGFEEMWAVLSPNAQKTKFDKQHESYFDAELKRMSGGMN